MLAAWQIESGAFVPLARSVFEDIRLLEGQPRALAIDRGVYAASPSS
jgi:hypothetical protein